MYIRQNDLRNATQKRLQFWMRHLEVDSPEWIETRDELLFRKWCALYGEMASQQMMDELVRSREAHDRRYAKVNPPVYEQESIFSVDDLPM